MIEALWSVQFSTPQGAWGAGVVVFESGRVFGGDSMYHYVGHYQVAPDGTVTADVKVTHYSGPPSNVFGPIKQLDLKVTGKVGPSTMQAQGFDPSQPQRRLGMTFTKLANLP